ncbi:hypothetical protein GYMLUDRAFT_255795 [Collybiopsis luxurians FD-317 M1]|nr:hypothetical protein GYMLUDRAFT_255795 [Collybiopsis luxurians FD-317 M1]
MGYTSNQIRYVINHIFLPPKLPQENDQSGDLDNIIASMALEAAKRFRTRLDTDNNRKWGAVMKMLRDFRDLQQTNILDKEKVAKALHELNIGDSLALLIRAQNAGVIFRRVFGEGVEEKLIYECFEVTPPATTVLSTTGKLIMSFPGPAIQLPVEPLESKFFRKELASFLTDMNEKVIDGDGDSSEEDSEERRKSGLSAAQSGETTDPLFITSLLTGIMRGLGGEEAKITRIAKRVADDVLLKGSNKEPWRRSALWLVLRVALQTTLLREGDAEHLYKQFILFLHSYVLSLALDNNVDSDLLFTMRAKTCRRLAKLGDNVPESIAQFTMDVGERVSEVLQRRWSQLQAEEAVPAIVRECSWAPDQPNVAADTIIRLPHSQERIDLALGNSPLNLPPAHFEPREATRLRDVAHFGDLTVEALDAAFRADPFVNLSDFEFLVGRGPLTIWLEGKLAAATTIHAQQKAATLLFAIMRKYHHWAAKYYKESPEDFSLMVITLFELWIAIDKIAVASCPLLAQYSPEVPFDRSLNTSNAALLRPLLLRKSVDLDRLQQIDDYLRSRHSQARNKSRSVFSEPIGSSSFAVRYFDQNVELHRLKAQIERDAQEERDKTIRDLNQKTQERDRILRLYSRAEHDHSDESMTRELVHTGRKKQKHTYITTYDCEKCRLANKLTQFSVEIHEWPLPKDEDDAKRVVFELRVPKAVAQWRAATAFLLFDVCTPSDKRCEFDTVRPQVVLSSNNDLSEYMRAPDDIIQIITLASSTGSAKQFQSKRTLPATQDDVCVANRMSWRLYDPRNRVWVRGSNAAQGVNGTMFREADTTALATLPISSYPSSIYAKAELQFAVSATRHTSNQIIATQDVCPTQMSLHEFYSFASLRSGARLQWLNLLRELREGTLSWQNEEVGTLVSMLMWQVGCIREGYREEEGARGLEWHVELKDLEFGQSLLHEMTTLLRRVQGNWKEAVTVRTIALIASRLLASTRHDQIITGCYSLLREAREVTWEWVGQLEEKLQGCGEEFVKEFQAKVCEMACACRATYDVDDDERDIGGVYTSHLDRLLTSTEDVAKFVACGIIIHDNKPHDLSAKSVPKELKRMIERDRRLAHGVEPALLKLFTQPTDSTRDNTGFAPLDVATVGKEGFNMALKRIWPVFAVPALDWHTLAEPNHRWVECETAGGTSIRGIQSQQVDLDLIHGKLLVNGKPLGRLPTEFIKHPNYVRLFGEKKVLDVVPADMPGMQFATRGLVSGYQVLFGMRGENDVIIRAKRDNTVFELIPHTAFADDLPKRFVDDNVHWLNLSNGEIELRPLQSMWKSSPTNWVIRFSEPRRSCTNGSRALVDVNSWTFQMVAATLASFEKPEYLTVTCSKDLDHRTLSVDLPRYRLSFFRNDADELQCTNFPGMAIDHDDQSFGAFVGLKDRLVLKGISSAPAGTHRKVLVPFGEVEFASDEENHVRVEIKTGEQRDVRYSNYAIDTSLGALVGNASLKSRLYQIYLLALTSHCLPDPLTSHTGTEEALLEFNSAACLSFRELGEEETTLLVKIGKLTPNRFGHPQHNPKAHSVTWTSLPPLSHHYGFSVRAREILGCVKELQVFEDSSTTNQSAKKEKKEQISAGNTILDSRAASRNAIYYPKDIKTLNGYRTRDDVYDSRDMLLDDKETTVCRVSSNIWNGSSSLLLPNPPSLSRCFLSWSKVKAPSDSFRLSYNLRWLSLNMADAFLSIFEKCRSRERSREAKLYQLLFSLSAMVFSNEEYSQYVPVFIVAFSSDQLQKPPLPTVTGHYFDFGVGTAPTLERILSRVQSSVIPAEHTVLWSIPMNQDETREDYRRRREKEHRKRMKKASNQIANVLSTKWSGWAQGNRTLTFPATTDAGLFKQADVIDKVSKYFRDCHSNRQLLEHIRGVEAVIQASFDDAITWEVSDFDFIPAPAQPTPFPVFDSLSVLLGREAPLITQRDEQLWGNVDELRSASDLTPSPKLNSLLSDMQRSTIRLRQNYAKDLQESQRKLNSLSSPPSGPNIPFGIDELDQHRRECEVRCSVSLNNIITALGPLTAKEKAIANAGLWPRITLKSLFRRLAYPVNASLTNEWQQVLLYLARDVLEYQRSVRLLAYAQQAKREDFFREVDTQVFDMASATVNLDWVLIQIEGNFLARPLQVRVAQEMISPSSNENTVLQLNMGEGKSSVIVPLVAAALADGRKIVRVVVLKPLAGQMFQLLVERLSGLVNRRIFYMPFSRKVQVGKNEIALIQKSYEVCMKEGGVWIVQPEHILSFKLMGIDRCLVSNDEVDREAAELLSLSQRWLDNNSRDILDESDEILHIRYQLVYTVGQQQPLELHPDRWTITEELFSFVSKHLEVKERNKGGIDIQPSINGSFAPVRILDKKAGQDLIEEVIEEIFAGHLSSFNVRFLPDTMQVRARDFITQPKLENATAEELRQYCGGGNDWKHLLLLRGLIAHGILVYALKERHYRVDFGLDLSRSLLAVPYRAKDVPSIRAEFGHPDVAVVLTCLTYYYEGLSSAQLKLCFDLLFKLDNPPLEYQTWVDGDLTIPVHLRTLNGINPDDADQHTAHIIPLFSKRKTVVDFYLSHVVFPKAAKEFPYKLSSSGWDLAELKPGHVTTGFSGTNDNRFLLPTSIFQRDPLEQDGTNAKVLNHLLQKENNHYRCAAQEDGSRLPVKEFLDFLSTETSDWPVQVLLDVGAQMLDLKNDALAREWLKLRPDMSAAIFFNDKDEMIVVSQDGTEELLISSPFKGQLDQCLVYLDDAHTRGTDLKLPINSRAAVTLGPKVTKDRLIQGCMRMRKLGYGQSAIFFAPFETDKAIRDKRKSGSRSANIHTIDILRWAMYETCQDIMHHVPHWAEQGWDYLRRRQAWDEFNEEAAVAQEVDVVINPDVDTLKKVWMREEARSLEKMYGCQTGPSTTGLGGGDVNMRESILAIPELRERLDMLGVKELREVNVDEEQEREVSHEIERETHVERPPRVSPANHSISNGLRQFISEGVLPANEDSEFRKTFIRMFRSIEGAVKRLPLYGTNNDEVWSPGLYVTMDFAKTISAKDALERGNADYLRPLNWVLTSRRYASNNAIIGISSFEANGLLPEIRKCKSVNLHIYAPRVTKDMLPLDDLKFYVVPRIPAEKWTVPRTNIISQLNLFAGQLYLANHDVYLQLCNFLGLLAGEGLVEPMEVDNEPYPIQSDGFVRPGRHRELMQMTECRFRESPVPFLQELIGLRRKGAGYLPTHLGRIVHGRLLKNDDFDY